MINFYRFFIVTFLAIELVSSVTSNENASRIASGERAKSGENLDFCYLSVKVKNKKQTCGCLIASPNYVVTSAKCIIDYLEKIAGDVMIIFPLKSGTSDYSRRVESFYVPDGYNGGGELDPYEERYFDENNFGLIRLHLPIKLDGKTAQRAKVGEEESVSDFLERLGNDYLFRACGVGDINNKGDRTTSVLCTDVKLVNSDIGECKSLLGPGEYGLSNGIACIQTPNRDNNLCHGDYGGPIYAYQRDSNGKVINQEAFCIAIGSPDSRHNLCQDGHTVYCQIIAGAAARWAVNIIISEGEFQ